VRRRPHDGGRRRRQRVAERRERRRQRVERRVRQAGKQRQLVEREGRRRDVVSKSSKNSDAASTDVVGERSGIASMSSQLDVGDDGRRNGIAIADARLSVTVVGVNRR
jgi:hypothetical protein